MTSTTLAAAVAVGDKQVQLASGTGVTGRATYNQATTFLDIHGSDLETVEVVSITAPQSTTIPSVNRGRVGTPVLAHPIGTPVTVRTNLETTPKMASPQRVSGQNQPSTFAVTIATATAVTLTPAQMLAGLILQDPSGGAVTTTTPTAVLLLAAMPNSVVGTSFDFTIRNTADAAETITVAGGTGVTISGTATIAQNNSKAFRVVFTAVGNAPTFTIYSLGTVVH